MIAERRQISLPWLTRLRWAIVGAEAAAVAVAHLLLDVDVPLLRVAGVIALSAAINVALLWRLQSDRPLSERLCGVVFAADTLLLTALLHWTGGAINPFTVVYLVTITLAAFLLDAHWTAGIAVLAVVCYGALFAGDSAQELHGRAGHAGHAAHAGPAAGSDDFAAHLQGMWLAFTLTAGLVAVSVRRLTAAIERRDREIDAIREQAERSERVAALTTLAAGAAHELGSPLATIAVAAGELERQAAALASPEGEQVVEDARLILDQLARCRHILDEMSAAAGEMRGEAPAPVPIDTMVEELRLQMPPADAARVAFESAGKYAAVVPRRALARVVGNLLRNALDPGVGASLVRVRVHPSGAAKLAITVEDDGCGMTPEVLAHATEPFFSTKATGRGMGMGLFLARVLAEQLGGALRLASIPAGGTSATVELPAGAFREMDDVRSL